MASPKSLIPAGAEVTTFEMPALKGKAMPTYQQIKSGFKVDALPKQNRFSLSDLVAGQLSVEQEEQLRFEKKVAEEVEARLKIIKKEAHDEAYKKGFDEGMQKAYDEEKARIAKNLESMAEASLSLQTAKTRLGEQYEQALIEIAFKVARVIVHKELEIQPSAIHATIAAILERIAKEDDVRVRISPREFEAIDQIKEEITKLARVGRVTFEMDPSVKPGNCVVDSLSGEIASFLDEKIDALRGEIEKARSQRRESVGGAG